MELQNAANIHIEKYNNCENIVYKFIQTQYIDQK